MKKETLGCMTPSAIIAGGFAVILTLGAYMMWGGQLFNPGALNAESRGTPKNGILSHADLTNSCATCHTVPLLQKGMNVQCINCHTEIKDILQQPANLHGALFMANNESINCLDCHTEHVGSQGEITFGDMHNFPHDMIGFSLQQHQQNYNQTPFECQNCHVQESYLDFTEQTCLECHAAEDSTYITQHVQDFGPGCRSCHDGSGNYGKNFDHSQTGFPLTGSHGGLACDDCHGVELSLVSLKDPASQCVSCHLEDDAHAGQFGPNCATCHTTDSWEAATFSHDLVDTSDCQSCHLLTAPPNHYTGQCSSCHITDNWQTVFFDHKTANATNCVACHQLDAPANHFSGQCSQCHVTTNWSQVTFKHSFPLNHGGANGQCALCHQNSSSGNYQAWTCYGCHAHNPDNVRREHREEGISNFENCIQCHANGREHEGGRGGDD